jgi:Putative Ig domain
MKETLIDYRLTRVMQLGLINLLLTLSLATASLPAFSADNLAPVISGTPATSVVAGSSYYFRPTATDANGDRLRFTITSKPAWANFSTKTGRLSGTPGLASVGTYSNIVISVSDRKASTSLPAFAIQVDAATVSTANSAPVISGTPATSVLAGSAYSFQPTATDADADPLSFSISNMPAWASFSTTTGQLSGTPVSGSVGTYSNIVISVTDGKASANLRAFAIQVDAVTVQTGSLALNWEAPVTRADGTPLSLADINGYRIHYGKSAGDYTSHVELADGTAQQVTLTDLPLGTYYLVMTTYDVTGLESGYSSEVTKNVQ